MFGNIALKLDPMIHHGATFFTRQTQSQLAPYLPDGKLTMPPQRLRTLQIL